MKALALVLIASLVQPVRYGLVTRSAARLAAADWKRDSTVERGYCIAGPMSWAKFPLADGEPDTVYAVWRMTPAVNLLPPNPDSIKIDCGGGVPTLHTHPPDSAVADCNPSREDYDRLAQTGAEFSVVQCGERSMVFYFPLKP